jgi:hypothetical protein
MLPTLIKNTTGLTKAEVMAAIEKIVQIDNVDLAKKKKSKVTLWYSL